MPKATPHEATAEANEPIRCGAKTRAGHACRQPVVPGRNRCHYHGGKSLRGPESPTWKHGLYARYGGDSLKKIIMELETVDPEELIKPESEIRLMQALLLKCKALETAPDSLEDLDVASRIAERLVKTKQRAQRIDMERQRLIPTSDVEHFLDYLEEVVYELVDGPTADTIVTRSRNFRLAEPAPSDLQSGGQ